MSEHTPEEMMIVPMEARHWPAVREIFRLGIDTHFATFRTAPPDWQEFDAGHCAPGRLVAVADATTVGWAALSPAYDRGFYDGVVENSIYVHPDHVGMGVGKELLCELLAAADRAGYWTVEARIIKENRASLALHKACGFREAGVRERLGRMQQTGRWHDVVFLEKRSERNGIE